MREATVVHMATDGRYLYVRFDATQSEPIVATQRTDDVGQGTDDQVWVDLWPGGANGYFSHIHHGFELRPKRQVCG